MATLGYGRPRLMRRAWVPSRAGQSVVEFVVFITAIVTALIIMLPFVRSSISGRFKNGADGISQGKREEAENL